MKTITIGGETLEISDEMLAKIREEQKPKKQYVVTGYGDVLYGYGDVLYGQYSIVDYTAHNMSFDTEEQAEAQALRMKGVVRRYLPKRDEGYKTVDLYWRVTTSKWSNDRLDLLLYHAGAVWPTSTPDKEIEAWVKEYRAAWETV